jgi:hypothetical protein
MTYPKPAPAFHVVLVSFASNASNSPLPSEIVVALADTGQSRNKLSSCIAFFTIISSTQFSNSP